MVDAAKRTPLRFAVAVFLCSLLVVLGGYVTGKYWPPPDPFGRTSPGSAHSLVAWDGKWYLQIATSGYEYRHFKYSSIAFFPAYPLIARGLTYIFRVPTALCLVILSNAVA